MDLRRYFDGSSMVLRRISGVFTPFLQSLPPARTPCHPPFLPCAFLFQNHVVSELQHWETHRNCHVARLMPVSQPKIYLKMIQFCLNGRLALLYMDQCRLRLPTTK